MAELANGNVLKVPPAHTPHIPNPHSAQTARNKILGSSKKHMFKRRDTPMSLNHVIESQKSPKRFVPKFESSFEEPEPAEESNQPEEAQNDAKSS